MKYKKLTKEQIIISLDRLTRFKNTKEKYLRVFSDILSSCLFEPKFKKGDIEKMDFSVMAEWVSLIINSSLQNLLTPNDKPLHQARVVDESINLFLSNYENSVFINDKDTQKLLNNNIDYRLAAHLIPEDCPINLKWLKQITVMLSSFQHLKSIELKQQIGEIPKQVRNDKKLKYPIEEVILVEGITEEILLPAFAKYLGYDFYAKGVQIIPAGGKNQVVKMYYKLANELKLPIFVLLDRDAEDNINQIKPKLRDVDRIHLVSCGEFEDLLPKSLIIKTVNSLFKNFLAITETDLSVDSPTAKVLEEIFKTKGLHEFKKAEFAKLVRENITSENDISPEIKTIIEEISFTNKMLDSEFCS